VKRESTQSNLELRESLATTFAGVLNRYMDKLGLEQTRLAETTGISRPEISIWCSGKKRAPSWVDTGTLAWAIYGVMRERKKQGQPVPTDLNLDAAALMKEFLNAAGFRLSDKSDVFENQRVWAHLHSHQKQGTERVLKLGWFPWGTFARPTNFGGLSEEFCQRLAELLGVVLQPVPLELPEVGDKLNAREVDLVAPLILLPARVLDFACSKELPGLHVGLGLLAPKTKRSLFPESSTDEFQVWKQIPWGKLKVFLVKGGVADVLLTPHRRSVLVQGCGSFQEAWEAVRSEPVERSSNLVRVFMADAVSCHGLQDNDFPLVAKTYHQLPVAFAVHRSETRLLTAINLCVDIIAHDIKADQFKFSHFENNPTAAGFKVPDSTHIVS